MMFVDLPDSATWQHRDAREGFEVAFVERGAATLRVRGTTAAIESGEPWWVQYTIELDAAWRTRRAHVMARARSGAEERTITSDGDGRWRVDGVPMPALDGCLDVDLESSALTNAFPVRRLALAVGEQAPAPAVYVRALGLAVERLEQQYYRLPDDGEHRRFDYVAPVFDVQCVITYDAHGLAVDYPGIATRVR